MDSRGLEEIQLLGNDMAKVIRYLIVCASLSWGLTNGPEQPEYQGFTNSAPKDLVNLYTGDLNYTIPLVEVPGRGDRYSLAMEYVAGIPLEMEASWVGLGWNLKPGAITRDLNMYPDDFNAGRQRSEIRSPDKVKSVNRTIGVNGVYGSWNKRSDIGSTYGFGYSYFGVGAHYTSRDGFDLITQDKSTAYDYFMLYTNFLASAMANSTASGLSDETRGQIRDIQSGVEQFNNLRETALSVYSVYKGYKQGGMSQAINNLSLSTIGIGSSTINTGSLHQESNNFNLETVAGKIGSAAVKYLTGGAVKASYRRQDDTYWIHKNESNNKLYGFFNVGNYDGISIGENKMEYQFAGDHDIDVNPEEKRAGSLMRGPHFQQNAGMVQTTHDIFQIGAYGFESGFRAYREDLHTYYGLDPFESGADISSDDPWFWQFLGTLSSKVAVKFNNAIWGDNYDPEYINDQIDDAIANAGKDHGKKWKSIDASDNLNLLQAGLDGFPLYSFREIGDAGGTYQPANFPKFDPGTVFNGCTDGALGDCPVGRLKSPDILDFPKANGLPILPNRISGSSGIFPLFQTTTGLPGISSDIPANTLVGFTVLTKDGKVYEFHKPLFNYKTRSNSYESTREEDDEVERDPERLRFKGIHNYNTMERPYAYAWMLTAVKSPDYVDLTNNGPTYDDFGSWFRFGYGKSIKGYHWRTPFEGALPSGVGRNKKMSDIVASNIELSSEGQSSWGYKDVAYLTDIHSPTHHLVFALSDRQDGREANVEESVGCDTNTATGTLNMPTVHTDFLYLNIGDRVTLSELGEYTVTGVSNGLDACTGGNASYCPDNKADLIKYNGREVFHKYGLSKVDPVGADLPLCGSYSGTIQFVSRGLDGAGRNPYALQRLDAIRLYANTNGTDGAIIQRGEFGYESVPTKQLAPNIPNHSGYNPLKDRNRPGFTPPEGSNGGKLTLRTLSLGSGESFFNPYRFTYNMEGYEAPYAAAHFDRWGYYNRNGGHHRTEAETGEDDVMIDHRVNPQDVQAWSLKSVVLPSGAKMEMEYESDSYTYVGRARAIEAGNFRVEDQVGPATRMRLISKEKGPMSITGTFLTKRNFTKKEIQDAATTPPVKDQKIRVSSVFRLYRPIDGATGNGSKTQMNPVFSEIQRRQGISGKSDEEKRLHLLALYFDNPLYDGVIMTSGPRCAGVDLPGRANAEAPAVIDLGSVDPSQWSFAADAADAPANRHCQLGWVEFNLSKLRRENIQLQNQSDYNLCMTTYDNTHIDFIAKHYRFFWGYKRDIDKLVANGGSQPDHDAEWKGKYYYGSEFNVDYSDDGSRFSYPINGVRRGYGAWNFLTEFTIANDEAPPTATAPSPFKPSYWDVNSYMVHREIEESSPLKEADGIAGGGLRAKRISFNSGWNQENNRPSQFSYTEYLYDCNGGRGGPFSSGATASVPPPFDNYGDDRIIQDPSIQFVTKPPQVGYRTVAEKRKGRGRIVYEFISSADVNDLLQIEPFIEAPHYSVKIHRMSQLSGQLWRKTKFSEANEIVAREEKKYGLSVPQSLLNLAANISVMNSSDAKRLHEAVVPSGIPELGQNGTELGTVPYHAGPSVAMNSEVGTINKEFNHHPAAADHGVTRQRYEMLWYFGSDFGGEDVGAQEWPAKLYKARIRTEDIEYRVSLRSMESTEKGVGSISENEYFDFFSGDPLIAVQKPRFDATLPKKSVVSVPAHWMYSSGTGRKLGSIYLGTQWMSVLNNQAALSTIPYTNNLLGIYSTSDYVDLDPMSDEAEWRNQLTGEKLVKQGVVTWGNQASHAAVFPEHGAHSVWAPVDELSLRVPLKRVNGLLKSDATGLLGPTAFPAQFSGSANHITTNKIMRYDKNLIVLENADANGVLTSKFVTPDLQEEGLIFNASRSGSLTTTVDGSMQGWALVNATVSNLEARSGSKSIRFNGVNHSIAISFSGIDVNRSHHVSFWIKSKSPNPAGGTVQLGTTVKPFNYNYHNPREWQRVSVSFLPSELNGTGHSLTVLSTQGTEFFLDDLRFAPEDALVYTKTYRGDGKLQSLSNENDVISYFSYDEFGRLMEIKDYQGIVRSTQAVHQAVR